jgi:TRAP-type mannitol/chloroaromatic compound transport system substrate-binding protein
MQYHTRFALGICAALALTAPAAAQTKWNLPGAYPSDNPHTENLVLFAKDVADATGGKLQIAVHANASLFKAPEIKRAVQTGQAQMGEVLISLHENEDPIYGLDVVPFLATSFEQAKKLWEAQKPAVEKKLDDFLGIPLLVCHDVVKQFGGSFIAPVRPRGGTREVHRQRAILDRQQLIENVGRCGVSHSVVWLGLNRSTPWPPPEPSG